MKNDPRSYDRNFCNCVKKPEKNFDFSQSLDHLKQYWTRTFFHSENKRKVIIFFINLIVYFSLLMNKREHHGVTRKGNVVCSSLIVRSIMNISSFLTNYPCALLRAAARFQYLQISKHKQKTLCRGMLLFSVTVINQEGC